MIVKEALENYKVNFNYFEDNIIKGTVQIEETIDVINIVDVFVKEEYRRKCIAFKLIEFIKKEYSNKEKIMLEVRVSNINAINLYKKCGFDIIYKRDNYYKDEDAYIMEVKLLKDVYILAIESSCDETSCSIVRNGKDDIATVINTQIETHKIYGGVVPEVASRMHLENITLVIDECLKKANMSVNDVDAVAVTYSPGLLGSLLVGVEAAKALAFVYNKPLIKVNHMMGHILANNIGNEIEYPLVSLIVSGGHTDLIYMQEEGKFEYLGSTLDDAVGECFDKVARILDMPYPGGPNVEKLALTGKDTYNMPKLLDDDSYNFSFSGIKSHVNNLVHNAHQRKETINKEDLACSFQNAVTNSLVNKSLKAIKNKGVKNFCLSGGVASNTFIRNALLKMCEENNIKMHVPDKKYCTDNATMIGAAAYILYKNGKFADLSVNASPSSVLNIEDYS